MAALTAERRTPFQIRPIERPFNRFLPAVDKMKSNVMQTIRSTGDALAHRMHRSHVEDSARLHEARATIATQIHKPSVPKVLLHGAAESAKNSAPAMIVGAGARVALGTALGAQALTVAAGASAVSRGVREATFTIRKGTFAQTTKHISKHEEASTLKNFNGTTREAHTGIRAQQDRFALTGVGKVVNAVLHGGEKKIAEFAYGKHRHAKALKKAQYQEVSLLSDKDLIKLREHAVMARITNGTACDVYATRQLAKSTYQTVNRELAKRGIDRREAHERQLRLYKKDVRIGAGINVVGQAGLAALKAVPKTIGTFFAVEDIMRVLHITSHRHNPLEGLDQSMLGHAVQNAKTSVSNVDLKQKFAHVGDNAIAWIGKVIAPKSVAYADELMPDTSSAVQTAASNVRHATRAVHASASTSDWTHGAGAHATRDPRITEHTEIVNGKTMVSGSGVLASESPKPMGVPGVPDPAPLVVEVDKRHVAHAVAQVHEHVTTPQVVTTIVHEQIGGKTSLTQDIFDRKLIPGMESAPDAVTWYGQSGTAAQMMQHIIIPNSDKLTPDQITQLQEYVNAHPDASFGALWHANRNVFTGGMDTWTMGTGYNVAVDHVVNQQDTLAAAQIARVEQVDNAGSGRVSGHAMIAVNNTVKPVQGPPQPTRMSNDDYLAMRRAIANGQQVSAVGTATGVNSGTGHLTSEEYLAMTRQSTNVSGSVPVAIDHARQASNATMSYEEYQRLVAQTQQANANLGGVVNDSTTVHSPRMDTDEYLRIQRETAVKAAEAARTSQQMDPQEYMRKVAEINARNGGVVNINTTPATHWEATQVASTWLDPNKSYTATFTTTDSHFSFNNLSLPAYDLSNSNSANFNTVTAYFNSLGGYNIELHAGELRAYGVQAFEPIRDYLQGGANIPRLGPIQEAYRAQQLINHYTYLDIALGGKQVGGAVNAFHHVIIENGALLVPPNDLDGIIGGGPDITALIGCSRGHVQAIQMLLDAQNDAPDSLLSQFAVLRNQTASGDSVEQAVLTIVNNWFKNDPRYADFYKLYGYLNPSELTDAKYDELENAGYFTAGRLVFDLINNGGQ